VKQFFFRLQLGTGCEMVVMVINTYAQYSMKMIGHDEAEERKAYPSSEDLIFVEQNADTYLTT
jgi:hypothetical protein